MQNVTRPSKAMADKYAKIAAKMTDAELRFAHKDVSDVFELAIKDGRDVSTKHWAELDAYQAEAGKRFAPAIKAEREEAVRMANPEPPHYVSHETVDGGQELRFSSCVRVF